MRKERVGSVVVGLQFGDEGKGITTDFLASIDLSTSRETCVVRFSGGQQVGHTVKLNGYTHVHSNFGSGTLRGLPTYYSEHTTIYPTTIARELEVLRSNGFEPKLVIHPMAMITTPWDVLANRRDDVNMGHGSCGLGIGKTQKRQESPYKLYAIDLLNPDVLFEKLTNIADYYYSELGPAEGDERHELSDFNHAVEEIQWNIQGYDYLLDFGHLIFEGSQGILLDRDFGIFPNVTHSNTTSKNAHEIMDKIGIEQKDRHIFYATRSYSTRHGEGLFNEQPLDLKNHETETNVFNEFQLKFKVAPLDYELINRSLRYDNIFSSQANKHLVITCMDQLEGFKFEHDKIHEKFNTVHESWSQESKDFKFTKIKSKSLV